MTALKGKQRPEANNQVARIIGPDTISGLHQTAQALITRCRNDMLIDGDVEAVFVELIRDTPDERH
eukprot:39017-Eustigmatos_ZCMA.PRE.1